VLLVHRPRHGDWTFPKGKVEEGETDEQAALREVEEETGLRCELGTELASTSYTDARLRPKTVRYWAMEVSGAGAPSPSDGVDEVVWLPLHEAAERLTYGRDRDVLRSLEALL
jgi:8-oxo-dGTP diphosphatase